MEIGKTTSFVNPSQINTDLLSQMPSQVTPYTVENILTHLGRAVPALSIDQQKQDDGIIVEIQGVEIPGLEKIKHIKISTTEDISNIGFNFLTVGISKEIEQLINAQDFFGALSSFNKFFGAARNYMSQVPQLANQIVNKLLEFCQSQRSSVETIARSLGADGYSISMPPSLSLSFALERKANDS